MIAARPLAETTLTIARQPATRVRTRTVENGPFLNSYQPWDLRGDAHKKTNSDLSLLSYLYLTLTSIPFDDFGRLVANAEPAFFCTDARRDDPQRRQLATYLIQD